MKEQELVEQVLKEDGQELAFETSPSEDNSPLNEPVLPRDGGPPNSLDSSEEREQPESHPAPPSPDEMPPFKEEQEIPLSEPEDNFPPPWGEEEPPPLDDAPEQPIGSGTPDGFQQEETAFELPKAVAEQTADTFLGIANNLIEVGGGFFVRIPKHKSFYEFEEIVRVIDEQSDRNIQRLKLDAEDKALLRPLIIQILQRRAKQMTPEQQALAAVISILLKKFPVALDIRRENKMLLEQIKEIVAAKREPEPPPVATQEAPPTTPTPQPESVHHEIIETAPTVPAATNLADQVMEVSKETEPVPTDEPVPA